MRRLRVGAHHRTRLMVSSAVFIAVLLAPQLALANVQIQNYLESSVSAVSAGPSLYDYHDGDEELFDLRVDFDRGTYLDTEVDATGTKLQLASAAPFDWWDSGWGARRCFEISNGDALLLEHQVRIEFDSTLDVFNGLLQPDGADYRAIADDDVTELDLYVESGVGTSATTVWVQLDVAGFTTTNFCLYFDNSTALSVSSQADVFSYDVPRELYFPAWWRLDGSGGADGTIDIVSYVDNNQITIGGVPVVLDAGQTSRFSNVTENTTIFSTGPLGGRGTGGGMDAIAPISFAGTEMVFPTNRSNQRWTIVSPTDAVALVEIYNGTTLAWSGAVGSTPVTPAADVTGGRSGVIRSTNGVPIIVTHTASNNSFSDALVVPPFFGDDIYGVRSRNMNIGFDGAGSVDIFMSDGTMATITGAAGSVSGLNNGADFDGNGTAMRLTNMVTSTGALQQADRDGYESTAFLPERLLDREYFLPTAADYVAFACPTATTIMVGGTPIPCMPLSPAHPGHAIAGAAAAGTHIVSTNGASFFAYYEDSLNQDETNLLGMKSAWAFTPAPLTITESPIEILPSSPLNGTWTSPIVDTLVSGTNVFGLLTTFADLPADTAVTLQIARGATPALALAAPFVGPDGTTATTFLSGETPLPYTWDFGDTYYVLQVQLSTTTPGVTPTVDSVAMAYDLAAVSQTSLHTVETNSTLSDLDWVLRVWTEDVALTGSTATLTYLTSTGLTGASSAALDLDGNVQIVISGTGVPQMSGGPVLLGPGAPHSIAVDTQNMGGVDLEAVWQAQIPGTGILIPHQVRLSFI